uniref:Uncharacterized protein n=1 Tax=Haptolina brevifila TaxID=156173 RepID=A0A7S2GZ16_9EUKA
MKILAEAMAMHCRTRSVDEIVGFMCDEMASRGKRSARSTDEGTSRSLLASRADPSAEFHAPVHVDQVDHSHMHPTTSCDLITMDCTDECMEHAHACDEQQLSDSGLVDAFFTHSHSAHDSDLNLLLREL